MGGRHSLEAESQSFENQERDTTPSKVQKRNKRRKLPKRTLSMPYDDLKRSVRKLKVDDLELGDMDESAPTIKKKVLSKRKMRDTSDTNWKVRNIDVMDDDDMDVSIASIKKDESSKMLMKDNSDVNWKLRKWGRKLGYSSSSAGRLDKSKEGRPRRKQNRRRSTEMVSATQKRQAKELQEIQDFLERVHQTPSGRKAILMHLDESTKF